MIARLQSRLQTFGGKLLLLFVFVVAAAQFTTWFVVSRANRIQARSLIEADLGLAANAFDHVVAERNALLAAGALTAAGDYAFKQLFAGVPDRPTLASALESIQLRIGADLVIVLDLDSRLLASTSREEVAGNVLPALVAAADADLGPNPRANGYGYLGSELHSLVVAPVRAPDFVAWLVIGFHINSDFAARLRRQTPVDITFADQDARIVATTLAPAAAAGLSRALPDLVRTDGIETLALAGESALVSTRMIPAGEGRFAKLALQYSLDEKLRPARATERLLLGVGWGSLFLAGLLSLSFARRLSRPIKALVAHTRLVAAGDYATRIDLHRKDELGRLAQAFNAMSTGLAERDRVRDLLDKNVSPEVATQLMRDGAALGGEEREVTILFADLRGFTPLSETLPPRDLVTLLNRYLDRMSRAIEAEGGVIDKYIGDEIMALFGAPVPSADGADRAIRAALGMRAALAELNREFAAEGRPQLAFGVGINTAHVVAGNIGSRRRLNYSVIGDGVNLAARLQTQTRNPDFAADILVSAATLTAARGRYHARDLGEVAVKGRTETVRIHAMDRKAD